MSKVELAEMRTFLEETTARSAKGNKERGSKFRNAPAWVVRRVYEIRQGLTLTPLPAEAYKNANHGSIVNAEEKLRMQARIKLSISMQQ
jgi:hypothetical protein